MIPLPWKYPFSSLTVPIMNGEASVFHLSNLSYGLVLVYTVNLCLLDVNGVPFIQSVIWVGM